MNGGRIRQFSTKPLESREGIRRELLSVEKSPKIDRNWVMCGRFTLRRSNQELSQAFDAMLAGDVRPRYNVAPTQDILTVRESPETGNHEAVTMHWALIPPWAPDEKIGNNMINCRAETIIEKKSFKGPLAKRLPVHNPLRN
jgi:hypothetical protein